MWVSETSPERLVIEDRHRLLLTAVAIGAVIAAVFGLGLLASSHSGGWAALVCAALLAVIFIAFARHSRLTLDRKSGVAEFEEESFFGKRRESWALGQISGADIEANQGGSRIKTYRPLLVLASGERRPISQIFASGTGASRVAETIVSWLGTSGHDKDRPPKA